MASRRFAQRGHASLSVPPMGPQAGGPGRLPRGPVAAVLLAALGLVWLGSCALYRDTSAVDLHASASTAGPPPSVLGAALARMDDIPRSAVGTAPAASSGLDTVRLTEESLKATRPLIGQAEARLIEVYQLIGQARHREALRHTEALLRAHPNFQLAHLVHGDLLSLQARPTRRFGDVPETLALAAPEQLATLREESARRLRALTERPPEGSVPTQFLHLSPQNRHAIAIDASRSRLYLFENLDAGRPHAHRHQDQAPRLKLISDFYISVGLSGIEKNLEGDKRTPTGVYFITSTLNPANLPDLYGVGALPINYPNPLDAQRGKTGSGIWLHGTPSEQFSRAPQASDGCVVLSNPDLERVLSTVRIRTTPVVIAPELQWVRPDALAAERRQFEAALDAWRQARSAGDLDVLKGFYAGHFMSQGRDLAQWWPRVESEFRARGARELQLKDVSLLHWRDEEDTMVVTFGEVASGQSRGVTRRQYWTRDQDRWSIFFEGNL